MAKLRRARNVCSQVHFPHNLLDLAASRRSNIGLAGDVGGLVARLEVALEACHFDDVVPLGARGSMIQLRTFLFDSCWLGKYTSTADFAGWLTMLENALCKGD